MQRNFAQGSLEPLVAYLAVCAQNKVPQSQAKNNPEALK